MRNLRLDICYDGTRYRGWQRLKNGDSTIQGKLEQTLSRILEEPISVSGSGRTDAGVHAQHQIANFHCANPMPCGEILCLLQRYLPEDIGIYSCSEVSDRFHARLNAKTKTYCYRVWNSPQPCVFERRFVAIDRRQVDLEAMRRGAKRFFGSHDFSAFCTRASKTKSNVRRIDALDIRRQGEELQFTVTGNGFLYNMVRILVGTLMEVGEGKYPPEAIEEMFTKHRADTGMTMPACGLCLMEVSY